ncbi:flagellin [Methylobacterium mesophilicum]
MSSYDVTLTASTRQNLLSLQDTASLTATNQTRLSTGKKVNSALDNPVNFFTSQSLTNRSGDLSGLLDGISNGIQTIQAANQGITSIQKLIDSAKSTANQALSAQVTTTGTAKNDYTPAAATVDFYVNGVAKTAALTGTDTISTAIASLNTAAGSTIFSADSTGKKIVLNASSDVEFKNSTSQTALGFQAGSTANADAYGTGVGAQSASADLTVTGVDTRAKLAGQYNDLLTQISQLANDASYNGVNLINNDDDSNKLHIAFNEKDTSNIDVKGQNLTASGLGMDAITAGTDNTGNWLSDTDVKSTLKVITSASDTLRTASSTFGSNLSVVQNRQDFSKQLINILQVGSDNLTNADMNAEAANSQALSTRQSLGISALSLANTAQQGILQLLR